MTASALAAAAMVYRVNPRTDRLAVRPDMIQTLLSTRQFAALLGESFAAAVPADTGGNPYRFVYEPGPGHSDPQQQRRGCGSTGEKIRHTVRRRDHPGAA